nr:CrcB family protein [Dermatophilus congolensis]
MRWTLTTTWPTTPGTLPTTTLLINTTGCLLMGALTGTLTHRVTSPYLRPFLGTGLLGGYTTFSTYAHENTHLLTTPTTWPTAALYLILTPTLAISAAALGHHLTTKKPTP